MSADPLPLAEAAARLRRSPGRPRKARPEETTPPTMPRFGDRDPIGVQAARLADVAGAARYLGDISTWTIRDLHASGRLPRVRLPLNGERELRRLLFDVRDLDRLIEASKETGA